MSVLAGTRLGGEKYPSLTGVRALGAIVVFFDHFSFAPDLHLIVNVMAFFFALSGFLIVRIYYEQVALTGRWLSKYFLNRFARIYPVYFLLLSIAVLLQHGAVPPFDVTLNYTLTHGLFPDVQYVIQPSWSLTTEECFYLLAPLFMILARRFTPLAPLLLGCVLLFAALAVARTGGGYAGFLGTTGFIFATTFFGHGLEFFAGAFLALALLRLEKSGSSRLAGNKYTLLGCAGVIVLCAAMIAVYRHVPLNTLATIVINNFLMPFPIAVLYWGLLREDTMLSRALGGRIFGLLGRASYSFYLLHTLIIDYISVPILLPHIGSRLAAVLVTFIVTWAVAIALYLFYEEPTNLFIRRKFHSKEGWVGLRATLFK